MTMPFPWSPMRSARILALVLPTALLGTGHAHAQTIYVTTYEDDTDFAAPQQVAQLPGPDGVVSMREAVTAANNTPGPQTIGFQIPTSLWGLGTVGPRLRNEGSPWVITDDGLTIDGTTQTAFTGDTNPNGHEVLFMNAHPSYLGSPFFSVYASGCTFRGLDQMLNRGYGLALYGSFNVVVGNRISGLLYAAVLIEGNDNVVGGTAPGEGNDLSSGNEGVRIEATASGNRIVGNFLHGSVHGVLIREDATGNQVGGFSPGEANWFSETGYTGEHGYPNGALVGLESDGNVIRGNRIGTNESGTGKGEGVATVGIEVRRASFNVIEFNVIGGMSGRGISIDDGSSGNAVIENWIGVDQTGQIPIPNGHGVFLYAFDFGSGQNVVDNLVQSNVIRHNLGSGVTVVNGQRQALRNRISRNSIDANGLIGIDLGGSGVTPNDPGDVDSGPNDLMNFPVLDVATGDGLSTVVTGTIDTPAPTGVTIELFASASGAQGDVFLGETTPNASGSFVAILDAAAVGHVVTATATDSSGNTSEFSAAVPIQASPFVDVGSGIAGANGVPELHGSGTLAGGTSTTLLVTGAAPNAGGLWVVGVQAANLPIPGGVLVPSPNLTWPLFTGAAGTSKIGAPLPASLPSGASFWVQALVVDAGATQGLAASNALKGTFP